VPDLLRWTEAEAKGRELQEPLAAPRRDVDEADGAGRSDTAQLPKHRHRIPEMFEYGDAEHDVHRVVIDGSDRIGERALDRGDPWIGFQIRRKRNVDERRVTDLVENRPDKSRFVAAAEITEPQAGEVLDVPAQRARREPDAEPIDRRQRAMLTVRAPASRCFCA